MLVDLTKDPYANYVVQRCIENIEGPLKRTVLAKLQPHMLSITKCSYAKHIVRKVEKYSKLHYF